MVNNFFLIYLTEQDTRIKYGSEHGRLFKKTEGILCMYSEQFYNYICFFGIP